MPVRESDPPALVAFATALAYRDPKTVTAYLSTLRDRPVLSFSPKSYNAQYN